LYLNRFIPLIKAEFSASLLQSSLHDPSEIILICWFAAQETILIIINVENSGLICFMEGEILFCGFFEERKVQNSSVEMVKTIITVIPPLQLYHFW